MVENKEKPVYKVKVGNVDVAVWEHKNDNGKEFHTISYDKSYLNEKEEWQRTKNLLPGDVMNLIVGLNKAYEFIKIRG